jgi:lipoprotein-releasing system permease protein
MWWLFAWPVLLPWRMLTGVVRLFLRKVSPTTPRWLKPKIATPNAVQVISIVSMLGLAVGTAALILVLAVFNGFEELITGLYARFNPEIKVSPVHGKYFADDTLLIQNIRAVPGVQHVSRTIEEIAFFDYEGIQDFGVIKGVDLAFSRINGIDKMVVEGQYATEMQGQPMAVLGGGMRNRLSVNVDNPLSELVVFMPKRQKTSGLEQPFVQEYLQPVGTFLIQQEIDDKYILSDLAFVQDLLQAPGQLSFVEIGLAPGAHMRTVAREIQQKIGGDFDVKDRRQQDASFIKLLNIEKALSFAVLVLTLVLVIFNIVGCLWMIALEKQHDFGTLKALGADDKALAGVMTRLGFLLSLGGLLYGFTIAGALYAYHKTYGLFVIPQGFVVSSYPALLHAADFIQTAIVVLALGLLATIPAAQLVKRLPALVKS